MLRIRIKAACAWIGITSVTIAASPNLSFCLVHHRSQSHVYRGWEHVLWFWNKTYGGIKVGGKISIIQLKMNLIDGDLPQPNVWWDKWEENVDWGCKVALVQSDIYPFIDTAAYLEDRGLIVMLASGVRWKTNPRTGSFWETVWNGAISSALYHASYLSTLASRQIQSLCIINLKGWQFGTVMSADAANVASSHYGINVSAYTYDHSKSELDVQTSIPASLHGDVFVDPYHPNTWDFVLETCADADALLGYMRNDGLSLLEFLQAKNRVFKGIYLANVNSYMPLAAEMTNLVMTPAQWHANAASSCEIFGSNSEFVASFKERYGSTPDYMAALTAFDAAVVLLAANKSNSSVVSQLNKAIDNLENYDTKTFFGPAGWSRHNYNGRAPVLLQAYQSSLYPVFPASIASEPIILPAPTLEARRGCPEGKIGDKKVQAHGTTFVLSCAGCPPGSVLNLSQLASAVPSDRLLCDACPAGKFADASGMSSCRSCLPGSFSNVLGSQECSLCMSGRYSDSGATICTACPRGTYAIQFATTSCTLCGADFSTPFPGVPSPTLCGCPQGRFLPMPPGAIAADTFQAPATGSCAECPWGMDCLGFFPGADEGDASLDVLPGHHRQPRTKKRFFAIASEPYVAYMCRNPKWCPGDRLPGDSCAKNRQYFGCGACQYFYVQEKSGDCRKCTTRDSTTFKSIAIIFILLFPLVVYFSYDVNLTHAVQSPKHVALSSGHIFVYFLEACAIMGDMNIKWPYPVDSMLSYSSVFSFNLDLLAPACALGKGYQFEGKYALSVSIPFIIGSYLGILLLLSKLLASTKLLKWRGLRFDRTVSAYGIIYVALYVAACRATLRVFECFKVRPDGRRQLSAFPYVECFSDRWWSILPLGIFAFLVYGIATFAGAIFLCTIAPKRFMNDDRMFCKCFGFLFHEYRRDCWWWLPLILIRNLSLPMVLVISPGDGQAQAAISFFFNLLYLIALLSFWPWLTHSINVTDLLTMGVGLLLIGSLTSSFMDETANEPNKAIYATLLTATLVVALATLACLWGGNMARHLLSKVTATSNSGCLSRCSLLIKSTISDNELAYFLLQVSEALLEIGKDDAGHSIAHLNYSDHQTIRSFVAIGLTEFCKANSAVAGLPQRLVVGDALMIALDSLRRSCEMGPNDPLHMQNSKEAPDVVSFTAQASDTENVVPNDTFQDGDVEVTVAMESACEGPCDEWEDSNWPHEWLEWPDRPREGTEDPDETVLPISRPNLCLQRESSI